MKTDKGPAMLKKAERSSARTDDGKHVVELFHDQTASRPAFGSLDIKKLVSVTVVCLARLVLVNVCSSLLHDKIICHSPSKQIVSFFS